MIEIKRMEKACEKEAFLSRVFTSEERRQAGGKPSVLAGTFAVKEAVAKVFGTGFRDFMPQEVEVLRDGLGKPYVRLLGAAEELAGRLGLDRIEVSISDTREYAMAFAVGERDGGWMEGSAGRENGEEDRAESRGRRSDRDPETAEVKQEAEGAQKGESSQKGESALKGESSPKGESALKGESAPKGESAQKGESAHKEESVQKGEEPCGSL